MMQHNPLGLILVAAAVFMSCLAPCQRGYAATPAGRQERPVAQGVAVQDIVLSQTGALEGRVLKATSATVVSLHHGSQMIGQTRTNSDGRFVFNGLRPGVYQLRTVSSVATCRLWSTRAAPPSAGKIAQLSAEELLVRGQRPLGSAIFGDPLILGAIILAGIAIPIIVHNTNDAPPAS